MVSPEEEAALNALSEVLISRLADVLSTPSETPLRSEHGIGEGTVSLKFAAAYEEIFSKTL